MIQIDLDRTGGGGDGRLVRHRPRDGRTVSATRAHRSRSAAATASVSRKRKPSLKAQFPEAQLLAAHLRRARRGRRRSVRRKQSQARFGRTDMLVNNAGQGRVSTFADTTDDAWREELDLKYFSVIRPTRAFLPMLRERDQAAVDRLREFAARAAARAAHGRDLVGTRRRAEPRQVARGRTRAAAHPRQFDPDRHRRVGPMAPPFRNASAAGPELGRLDRRTGAQAKTFRSAASAVPKKPLKRSFSWLRRCRRTRRAATSMFLEALHDMSNNNHRWRTDRRFSRAMRRSNRVRRDLDPQHADPRRDRTARQDPLRRRTRRSRARCNMADGLCARLRRPRRVRSPAPARRPATPPARWSRR